MFSVGTVDLTKGVWSLISRVRKIPRERRANVWVLLSDTDRFVSRAGLTSRCERQLRTWRARLQESGKNPEVAKEIREELIEFRRARRLEGWELRLGYLDIQLRGFRSDEALAVGFRRMVLMVGEGGEVRFLTGNGNHIKMDAELNEVLRQRPPSEPLEPHYLWFRKLDGVIELAGADSESKQAYEELRVYVESHKSDLVKALYKIS